MLNRGFFSLQAPWIPTVVALANLALNVALYAVFYRVGAWGIPLAISLANIAGVAMLLFALRRRIGRIDLVSTTRSFAARHDRPRWLLAAVVLRRLDGARRGARPLACRPVRLARRGARSSGGVVYLARLPRASGAARWRRYSPCETASARS